MKKKKTEPVRVPIDALLKIDNAMLERFNRKLITKKEYSRPEAFRLLFRTPEVDLALEKLKKLPRKENLI